jgi:hypothetical protein
MWRVLNAGGNGSARSNAHVNDQRFQLVLFQTSERRVWGPTIGSIRAIECHVGRKVMKRSKDDVSGCSQS